jgi:hypothetical protein
MPESDHPSAYNRKIEKSKQPEKSVLAMTEHKPVKCGISSIGSRLMEGQVVQKTSLPRRCPFRFVR